MIRNFKIKKWLENKAIGLSGNRNIEISFVQPFGLQSRPKPNASGVLIKIGPVCISVGTKDSFDLVNPGETALHSSNKMSKIILKEDGSILVNGVNLADTLKELHNIASSARPCVANICSLNPDTAASSAKLALKISQI